MIFCTGLGLPISSPFFLTDPPTKPEGPEIFTTFSKIDTPISPQEPSSTDISIRMQPHPHPKAPL